jgi:hypothetical protein
MGEPRDSVDKSLVSGSGCGERVWGCDGSSNFNLFSTCEL